MNAMIGFLKGKLMAIDGQHWIVETSGVGFVVNPTPSLATKYHAGDSLEIHIHTQVKEDAINLYGFQSLSELHLFEKLISVSGIGPKLAMSVFAAGSVNDIVSAISTGEVAFFTAVSGIGKKNAQRIIVDLKSKVGGDGEFDLSENAERDGAVAALISLGFSTQEAYQTLKSIDSKLTVSEQVKLALKNNSQRQ